MITGTCTLVFLKPFASTKHCGPSPRTHGKNIANCLMAVAKVPTQAHLLKVETRSLHLQPLAKTVAEQCLGLLLLRAAKNKLVLLELLLQQKSGSVGEALINLETNFGCFSLSNLEFPSFFA